MTDLIYRLEFPGPDISSDAGFHWVGSVPDCLLNIHILRRRFGLRTLARLIAACATPSRAFFYIERDGLPVSHGRVRLGHCDHYTIEKDAAVLGEIWSDPDYRGQGLATRVLHGAVKRLMAHGCSAVYIDTQPHNLPMRRAIDRCGFRAHGDPTLGVC